MTPKSIPRGDMSQHPEDWDLVQRCMRKQPEAWREFFIRFGPHIATSLVGFADVHGKALSVEQTQELVGTFVSELVRDKCDLLARYDGSTRLEVWLVGLAYRFHEATMAQAMEKGAVKGAAAIAQAIKKNPKILEELPPRLAEILKWRVIDNQSHLELANKLKIPVARVPRLIQNGFERLGRVLNNLTIGPRAK